MAIPYVGQNWYVYTSDEAVQYSVKISRAIGQDLNFGFGVCDPTKPLPPQGFKMRGIYFRNAADGRVRFIPVGGTTAHIWDGTHTQVRFYDEKDAAGALWSVGTKVGEQKKTASLIHTEAAQEEGPVV